MVARVELADFGPAPLDDWSCYPGRRPACSFLFCGDHLRVGPQLDLDRELAELGARPRRERRPVLAYGSNACPAQLRAKLNGASCSSVVPMARAWAHDLAVVYSDHESRYGAVPATVMASSGAITEVFVAWLDSQQFDLFDASEKVNYRRRAFDVDAHVLSVADAPSPESVDVYVGTRGVLTHDGVVPGVKGIDTTYRAGPLLSQIEIKALVAPAVT